MLSICMLLYTKWSTISIIQLKIELVEGVLIQGWKRKWDFIILLGHSSLKCMHVGEATECQIEKGLYFPFFLYNCFKFWNIASIHIFGIEIRSLVDHGRYNCHRPHNH